MKKNEINSADECRIEEIIQLILSGELEGVTIIGQSSDGMILDPLTEAKEFARAMGFETLTTLEKQNDSKSINWTVHSIGATVKGGCIDEDKS